MTWWVVVNPSAGRGYSAHDRAAAALTGAGVAYEIRESTSATHVGELVAEGRAFGATEFAAVGGDGTAHLVVNALLASPWERPPTFAILPAGSGSDFIRTFGLPPDLESAANHLHGDSTYPTDVGVVRGSFGTRLFLNEVSTGISAASAAAGARLPDRLGTVRYTAGFWLALPGFRAGSCTVAVDHHRYEHELIGVVIANGQFFGGGMNVAPRATVTDGELDVQCFSGPRRLAFSVLPRVKRGAHLTHKAVRRYSGSDITVRVPDQWPVEADGEQLGTGAVEVSVMQHAIRFKI